MSNESGESGNGPEGLEGVDFENLDKDAAAGITAFASDRGLWFNAAAIVVFLLAILFVLQQCTGGFGGGADDDGSTPAGDPGVADGGPEPTLPQPRLTTPAAPTTVPATTVVPSTAAPTTAAPTTAPPTTAAPTTTAPDLTPTSETGTLTPPTGDIPYTVTVVPGVNIVTVIVPSLNVPPGTENDPLANRLVDERRSSTVVIDPRTYVENPEVAILEAIAQLLDRFPVIEALIINGNSYGAPGAIKAANEVVKQLDIANVVAVGGSPGGPPPGFEEGTPLELDEAVRLFLLGGDGDSDFLPAWEFWADFGFPVDLLPFSDHGTDVWDEDPAQDFFEEIWPPAGAA